MELVALHQKRAVMVSISLGPLPGADAQQDPCVLPTWYPCSDASRSRREDMSKVCCSTQGEGWSPFPIAETLLRSYDDGGTVCSVSACCSPSMILKHELA
jgi:hypothetical protein